MKLPVCREVLLKIRALANEDDAFVWMEEAPQMIIDLCDRALDEEDEVYTKK